MGRFTPMAQHQKSNLCEVQKPRVLQTANNSNLNSGHRNFENKRGSLPISYNYSFKENTKLYSSALQKKGG